MSKKTRHASRIKRQKERRKEQNRCFEMTKKQFKKFNQKLNAAFNKEYGPHIKKA